MITSDNLFLIIAQDPFYQDAPIVGTNCLTAPSKPLLETDCLHPDDNFPWVQVNHQAGAVSLFQLPALHIDRLAQHLYLAFNPVGHAGVIVLNQRVLDLLLAFRQAQTLTDGVRVLGESSDGLKAVRRLAELGLLDAVGAHRKLRQSKTQTLTAWLHVTDACNLRCPYCYVDKSQDEMELERGKQAVDAVFRSALANGFRRIKLKYAGGEATLNFRVVLALQDHAQRLANQQHVELDGVVLSNGVALTDRIIQGLQAHGLRLMISLDGVGEYHDIQRPFPNGRGSFTHIERALDRLAKHRFKPSISITVSNRNLCGLPQVVDYLLKRKLPFTFNFYRENDCSASFTDLAYDDEQIVTAMQEAFDVIETNLPPYSLLNALVDLARLDNPHNRVCGVGHSYMVINQNGGVAKCHMELERTVADINAADPLQLIREDRIGLQNLSVEEKEGCRDCMWRYRCAGGCPALTYRVTGRFDIKSPNCRIYKALFPKVLRLEGIRLLRYSQAPVVDERDLH